MFRLYGKLPDRKDLLDRKLKVMNEYMGNPDSVFVAHLSPVAVMKLPTTTNCDNN